MLTTQSGRSGIVCKYFTRILNSWLISKTKTAIFGIPATCFGIDFQIQPKVIGVLAHNINSSIVL